MSGNSDKQGRLIPGWFWRLFICLPLGLMSWWFLRWFFLPSYKRTASVEIDTPRSDGVPLPVQKDDFRKIKGIGPKTAEALNQAGIYTFEQLALMEPEKLAQKLKDGNIPLRGAALWQKQAALAAAEDWEALEKLQG